MTKARKLDRDAVTNDLLRVLTAQYDTLRVARSDPALLDKFAALLKYPRSVNLDDMERILSVQILPKISNTSSFDIANGPLADVSLDEIERIANNEATSRKELEQIAIQRFKVPKGSMRSFSTKDMLVEKILTLVRNERAHTIIGNVARGEMRRP